MTEVGQEHPRRIGSVFFIGSLSFLLTALLILAIVYFWDEIQQAQAYGYVGEFLVSVPAGVTIIPAPSVVVTFTLGRVLNPVYIGLISGFGEALGGITVYLTGAGVETIWSRFTSYDPANPKNQPEQHKYYVRVVESKLWAKGKTVYNRFAGRIGKRGGSWFLFIAAAIPLLSLFYPAGIAAGSLRMGLKRFILVSWAGKTVKGLIVASAGYGGLYFLPGLLGN